MNWFEFIMVGILIAAILWSASNRGLPPLIRIATTFVGLIVLAFVFVVISPAGNALGNLPAYQLSPYREIIYFIFMIIGMLARTLSIAIEDRRAVIEKLHLNEGSIETKIPLKLDAWDLAYPMLFSVITFGALLSQVGDGPFTIATIVLAFQTGFFWQTIMKRVNTS